LDDLGDKERQKLKSNFLKINFHMDDSYFYKPKKDKMMGGVHPEDLKVDYTDVFQLVSQMKEHWDSFYDKKPDTIQIRKIDCFQYYLYLWFKITFIKFLIYKFDLSFCFVFQKLIHRIK